MIISFLYSFINSLVLVIHSSILGYYTTFSAKLFTKIKFLRVGRSLDFFSTDLIKDNLTTRVLIWEHCQCKIWAYFEEFSSLVRFENSFFLLAKPRNWATTCIVHSSWCWSLLIFSLSKSWSSMICQIRVEWPRCYLFGSTNLEVLRSFCLIWNLVWS